MRTAVKIRLLPTPEQEVLFWKSAGVARWSYNYFVNAKEQAYQEWLSNGKQGKIRSVTEKEIRKEITKLKHTTHPWLNEVSANVHKQAVKDANTAYQRFYKGISDKPHFKSKHKSKPSFYVCHETLIKTKDGFRGQIIGFVKTASHLPEIPNGKKYSNPRISFDGKHWYISVGYEINICSDIQLTDESLGIDLGIKKLANVSNKDGSFVKKYNNINKTKRVKQLKKRLKREQRKLSRKLENNTKAKDSKGRPIWKRPLRECKNIQRQNNIIRKIYKKLTDIRQNHLHQTTTEIVKTKPFRIVLEDLNVSGMMKNRHLAKAIAEQKFYEFRRQIIYKAERIGVKVVIADRFFPSSKTCSCCGHINRYLELSDRIYRCPVCGSVIDRDVNAAINLANYEIQNVA